MLKKLLNTMLSRMQKAMPKTKLKADWGEAGREKSVDT